ncbi:MULTISPECIES: PH domain-containing protein [Micromonospora]|uniref:PH domain-containing protein n=1 Tax=Micromonospora solifontis TaxID=2487138 RepID=A0ABX9W950_9ACTN|nr:MULTISPECIES: PH domain-containing protein [Micromonospora]NES13383.1 hypothetical protein [Micromonospora sp. PPF5-17B]NES39646.1 hypothetical protein [Micromonospora solifontis]NES55601.1 hypothetical protein [Micromonospora sp. PPF5-6]RNL87780.1 hypothetical protein EFE23_26570 [Micromonospora solifontis]
MASPTVPAPPVVHAPPGTLIGRAAVGAALLFSVARAVVVLTGGLPSPAWDHALGVAPFPLSLLVLVPVVVSQRGAWRRPARLVAAGPGRRRVPAAPAYGWFAAGQVLLLGAITSSPASDLFRDPEAPTAVRWLLPAGTASLAVLWLLLVTAQAVAVFRGRPRIDLTPSGVEIHEPFGRRSIPWAALAPGAPGQQQSGGTLRLRVVRPDLVERRGLVLSPASAPQVLLGWLPVHPWFLADVLRFYVDHAEERGLLGTPAGDERLGRALGVG